MSGGKAFSAGGFAPVKRPVLATPEQIEMEELLLRLLADPDIRAVQRQAEAELAATPTGRSRDGVATVGRASAMYVASHIAGVVSADQPSPAFLWWENAAHTLAGHTVWGIGLAGDMPDNIYRRVTVDGSGEYEITGRIDLAARPALLIFEAMRGRVGPVKLTNQASSADMGTFVGALDDRGITVGADGSFSIKFGGSPRTSDFIPLEPGDITLMVRETLSSWDQRPCEMRIRRVAGTAPPERSFEDIKARALEGLIEHVRFWGDWHNLSRQGIEPNTIKPPLPRDGGFGYAAHLRFRLGPGEVALLTISAERSHYFSVHVTDPWQITADSRHYQVQRNPSQSRPNIDGAYTYLIGPRDPGFGNWLDTAGLHDGYGILRWQGCPDEFSIDGSVRDFRIISWEEAQRLPGVLPVSRLERQAERMAQAAAYDRRASD